MTKHRIPLLLACLALVLLLPGTGIARSIWLGPATEDEIRLEAHKPNFEQTNLSFLSMIWTASADFQRGPNSSFQVEIPFATIAPANSSSDQSSQAIGNPYIGWENGQEGSSLRMLIGGRLPFASDYEPAVFLGYLTDFVDRAEAFLPSAYSVTAGAIYENFSDNGVGVRLRFAPVLWFARDNTLESGSEIWARYNVQFLIDTGAVAFGFGGSGRYLATDEGYSDFGGTTVHEFGVFAARDMGCWRPSARISIPTHTDVGKYVDPSFVFSLGYVFAEDGR
jgi:hypothetical protein